MNSLRFNDLIQLFGIAGLIASLVFVGFELKLSRQMAEADVYQQRTALSIQVQLSDLASFDRLSSIYDKVERGEALDNKEGRYFINSTLPWLSYWENVHFQHEMGLLSDEQWMSSRNSLGDSARMTAFQDWWPTRRDEWRESFAREVDALIAEADSNRQSDE